MPDSHERFIPGIQLNERFFREVVEPILSVSFPGLIYSAALIGPGSDVIGYDTARSTDHDWGPRLQIFLARSDDCRIPKLNDLLSTRLPLTFLGYSTAFGPPDAEGVRLRQENSEGPVDHKIEIVTVGGYLEQVLGFDPSGQLLIDDWLLTPQQSLLSVTAGRVFRDQSGELTRLRAKLAWYPHDIWLYLMGSQWRRIEQQEPFVGRSGELGDELGSRLIAAELVRDLMMLGFLMERRYAPYSKWFGTAYSELTCADELAPLFDGALRAENWSAREHFLVAATEAMARWHNALAITPPVDPSARFFHNRPFRVIGADRFVAVIGQAITSPEVVALIQRSGWIGGIDQFSNSVDLKTVPPLATRLRTIYR